MPIKSGKLTNSEKIIAKAMARTGDKSYAAHVAGVSPTSGAVSKALARPAVQAEIRREQEQILWGEILPSAVEAHRDIIRDVRVPASARVAAIKLAYDRTLGVTEGARVKEAHEMTSDEIADAIKDASLKLDSLARVASERARPIVDLSSIDESTGIFG